MSEEKKTFIDRIWDIFASVKFAIVIFSLISLTSIIGTVLEQRAEPERNINILTRLFGESLAPSLYNILEKLGFMDMYHSWWFITLLILFSANIIICSIARLPRILKLIKEPMKPMAREHFETAPIRREIVLKGKPDKIKEAVASSIRAIGFNFSESKEDKGYQFYAQRGNYTRLGVYLTHLSIIFILIGALIGIAFGYKGYLNLPEGRTAVAFRFSPPSGPIDEMNLERILNALEASWGDISKASELLNMKEKKLKEILRKNGIQPLGFSIRCEDFDVEFYENSNTPKEFKSWLTVIDGGKEVVKKSIEVNDPLSYKGTTFYQASYGMIPNAPGWFVLRLTSKSGSSEIKRLNFGEKFVIPYSNIEGTIRDFSPALAFDKEGRPFTFAEMMNNPAVFIDFKEAGRDKYSGWIYKRYPLTGRLPEGHIVEFLDLWGSQYTGLQIRKDPGVWIIYLASTSMTVGLFIAFFMSHRRLWVMVIEDRGNTKVHIAGVSNKNRPAFERKIGRMISLIKERQQGGK
ncbi:MAG: cytochrome c biogenesis protein ResB [Nitrospirae bacterium]|nr:cytochrome c biogenesis protein ResB [Nitrospirota bacterium]